MSGLSHINRKKKVSVVDLLTRTNGTWLQAETCLLGSSKDCIEA
jgi:hypothetical protein